MAERDASREVRLVEHDARWQARFWSERARLLCAAGGLVVAVEHVGSTAVPGLAAKPVIDIAGGVRHIADALLGARLLAADGWESLGEHGVPGRRFLRRWEGGAHSTHLHLVPWGGEAWQRYLRFRDRLRAEPELAREYAALKRELASLHAHDRAAYSLAKAPFVEAALGTLVGGADA